MDNRVDLDGINVLRAFGERDSNVVAGAGADNQDVIQAAAIDVAVRIEVEGLEPPQRRDGISRLVRDVVFPPRLLPLPVTRLKEISWRFQLPV